MNKDVMMGTGFSMTKVLFAKLEMLRGDVSRSKYIARLVEKELASRDSTTTTKRHT